MHEIIKSVESNRKRKYSDMTKSMNDISDYLDSLQNITDFIKFQESIHEHLRHYHNGYKIW